MSFEQFLRWQEYYDLEPFGDERDDLRTGTLISTIINSNIDTRKTKPYESYNYKLATVNGKLTLLYDPGKENVNGSRSKNGNRNKRKPLTDPGEWQRTLEMARALNGAYGESVKD